MTPEEFVTGKPTVVVLAIGAIVVLIIGGLELHDHWSDLLAIGRVVVLVALLGILVFLFAMVATQPELEEDGPST